ncbi:MAG: DUF4412 domain-containing protein [Thermoanaerobaculia bacterium]
MKTVMRGALVLLFAAATARAEFEGVADMKIAVTGGPGGTTTGVGKTYISPTGWRSEIEMSNPQMATTNGGKPFRLVNFGKVSEPDTMYTVNDARKTFAVVNTKEMREMAAKIEKKERKFTVEKLGRDRVADLPCQNVHVAEVGGGMTIDACLSREFASGEWMKAMSGGGRGGSDWMKAVRDAGVDGYPVRMEMTMSGLAGMKTKMEVTKIERRRVPASMFEIPPDYKQGSVMDTMVQSPEQAKQMEDAQKQLQKAMENMTPEQRKMLEEMMKKQAPPPKQ